MPYVFSKFLNKMNSIETLVLEAVTALTCSVGDCYHFAQFGINKPTHCREHVPSNDMRFCEFDMVNNRMNIKNYAKQRLQKRKSKHEYDDSEIKEIEDFDEYKYKSKSEDIENVEEEYNNILKNEINTDKKKLVQQSPKRRSHVKRKLNFTQAEEIIIDLHPKKKPKYICQHVKCKIRACFGIPGQRPQYCATHADKATMEDIINKKCLHEGCTKQPIFGIPGQKPQYCAMHADKATMEDIVNKKCLHEGCTKQPKFGIPGQKPQYCATHADKATMEDIIHKKCLHEGCNKRSSFGIPGQKPQYCAMHADKATMEDIINKKCLYEGCNKRPSFGIPGQKPQYCATHADKATMEDIINKKCLHEGCNKRPSFGIPGQKLQYCAMHADKATMEDIINKKCLHEGCNKRPSFGIPGQKLQYCAMHADKATMEDIIHKKCIHEGCNKRPSFGISGQKPLYCITHADKNTMIDLRLTRCTFVDCQTTASYGTPCETSNRCRKHREPGDIRRSTSKCYLCKQPAEYGTNMTAKRCRYHKTEFDICYIEKKCKECNLEYIVNADGKCEICDPTSRDFEIKQLHKQYELFEYLDSIGLQGNSSDKMIDSGVCGKERPDRVFDCNTFVIILECDEEQHSGRNCECEQSRMVNITNTFGGTPVYFIRWNPDRYKTLENEEQENIDERYACLGSLLKAIISGKYTLPNKGLCYAIYMYFDHWSGLKNEEWHCLLEFRV